MASVAAPRDQAARDGRVTSVTLAIFACALAAGRLVFTNGHLVASASDLLALVMLPVTMSAVTRGATPARVWRIATGIVAWIAALGLADAHAGSGTAGLLGVAMRAPLVLVAATTLLWFRRTSGTRITGLLVAAISGLGMLQVLRLNSNAAGNPWKYGLGFAVALAIFAWLGSRPRACLLACGALAAISVALDCRSLAAILVVAWVVHRVGVNRAAGRKTHLVRNFALTAAVLVGGAWLYATLASGGELGLQAQSRYQRQVALHGPLQALTAARPEATVSAALIKDQPLFGYGTRPVLTENEFSDAVSALGRNGYSPSSYELTRLFGSGVTTHSLLLEEWIAGGVVAFGIWLIAAIALWRTVLRSGALRLPALALIMTSVTWDLLLSPWSPGYEWVLGAAIALGGRSALSAAPGTSADT